MLLRVICSFAIGLMFTAPRTPVIFTAIFEPNVYTTIRNGYTSQEIIYAPGADVVSVSASGYWPTVRAGNVARQTTILRQPNNTNSGTIPTRGPTSGSPLAATWHS
ncbi:hypothetical protein BZA70DRAFT_42425 [Myxozyma melibiosi]|uniref:PEGA domain-containing protein n=1 Tax=Myxozyma melibiosi TaxID=54550 RepID=A0ABR1FEU0_9ASCO